MQDRVLRNQQRVSGQVYAKIVKQLLADEGIQTSDSNINLSQPGSLPAIGHSHPGESQHGVVKGETAVTSSMASEPLKGGKQTG